MLELTLNNVSGEKEFSLVFFEKITKTALAVFGLSQKRVGLSINLVGEARMRFLNKKYRQKDEPTDVLSFPVLNKAVIARQRLALTGAKKTGSAIMELGDIFFCLAIVRQKAQGDKIDPESRLCLLTIHSILHLLGFDHEREEDQKEMERLERQILNSIF